MRFMFFFGTWCSPCKKFSPTLDKFMSDHPEVDLVKIDVDQNPEVVKSYGVTAVPTLVMISDGKQQSFGAMGLSAFEKEYESFQKGN